MEPVTLQPVGSRRDRRRFLDFPWDLYRDDPHWVPPLRMDQKELIGYAKHPFHSRNTVQTFLSLRGGKVCGRIAAILNRDHIEYQDESLGFFGFFECTDDQEAANLLFDAVREWLGERDIHHVRGPCNPSVNYQIGLLTDGFDMPPTFMMGYNRPYYERLVETYGFRKSQDLFAFWGEVSMMPATQAKLAPIAEQIIDHLDIKLLQLDTSRFTEEVQRFLSIYNEAMGRTWSFSPMSDDELNHMAQALRFLMVPDLTFSAVIDGRVVGMVVCLPDYNPRVKAIDGRLFPFGWVHLLREKRALKKIRLISINVIPEYQNWGVGMVLTHGLVPRVMEWGIQECEFSWVMESNRLSRRALEKSGAKLQKTYRIYDFHPTHFSR